MAILSAIKHLSEASCDCCPTCQQLLSLKTTLLLPPYHCHLPGHVLLLPVHTSAPVVQYRSFSSGKISWGYFVQSPNFKGVLHHLCCINFAKQIRASESSVWWRNVGLEMLRVWGNNIHILWVDVETAALSVYFPFSSAFLCLRPRLDRTIVHIPGHKRRQLQLGFVRFPVLAQRKLTQSG